MFVDELNRHSNDDLVKLGEALEFEDSNVHNFEALVESESSRSTISIQNGNNIPEEKSTARSN